VIETFVLLFDLSIIIPLHALQSSRSREIYTHENEKQNIRAVAFPTNGPVMLLGGSVTNVRLDLLENSVANIRLRLADAPHACMNPHPKRWSSNNIHFDNDLFDALLSYHSAYLPV